MEKVKDVGKLERGICSWELFGDDESFLEMPACVRDNSKKCSYLPKGTDDGKGELLTYACKELHGYGTK